MGTTCVIGAGLSGLACAFDLARADADVVVLEAAAAPGGVAGTDEEGGFLFERGPNTLQASAATFRALCGDLGIADRLIASSERAKERYLWFDGRLQALPASPLALLATPLLSAGAKLRVLSEPLRRRPPHPADAPEPTARELFIERLGREPTERFAAAFVRGIYAGDLGRLGARSAFPRFWRMVDEHGGIVRGMLRRKRPPAPLPGPDVRRTRLLSFPRGLGELVDALAAALGERLRTETPAVGIERAERGWRVATPGGAVEAERVVVATPVGAAAELLAPHLPPGAVADLRAVPLSGVALVHLGLDAAECPLPSGFGFLVPPSETDLDVLGVIFASNLFEGRAPDGASSVSCFYPPEVLAGASPDEAARRAAEELARALGLARSPSVRVRRIIRWERAIPQYTVGHDRRMQAVLDALSSSPELRGLHLAGNFTGGVGVDPVLARGRDVARRILA